MEVRKKIPCSIIRGGTSRGIYFLEKDIPEAGPERDGFLLRVMGSPHQRQIDGLGGGASITNKAAIVGPSLREDADVDYTFAQVSVDKPLVSYKGNCGNISSGVGPFAIERGLVKITEPITEVRIYNTNTNKVIIAEVQVENGQVQYQGETKIAGVCGTAAPIRLKFMNPSGTISKGLLPTGKAVDVLDIPGFGAMEVSIVDAANPLVFVRAADVGMKGSELPLEIDQDKEKLELLEKIRGIAAVHLGLIEDYKSSSWKSPGIPKMAMVAEPAGYIDSDGNAVEKSEVDLLGRMMSMQKAHPTYAMTGAMCTAAAAAVPGSIVAQIIGKKAKCGSVRIGHPGGVLEAGADYTEGEDEPVIGYTYGIRTANLIMEGNFIDKFTSKKT